MNKYASYYANRRDRLKKECVLMLGGKCIICGYDAFFGALDFHHLDPNKKEGDIGKWISKGFSESRIKIECKKCILICCRCHRELHGGTIKLPI